MMGPNETPKEDPQRRMEMEKAAREKMVYNEKFIIPIVLAVLVGIAIGISSF